MNPVTSFGDITHVIQLAVAPVFLLTGVGTLLVVLTNRLARAVDRGRVVEKLLPESAGEGLAAAHEELNLLARRTQLIYAAITLAVFCALFVCLLIRSPSSTPSSRRISRRWWASCSCWRCSP